MTPKIESDLWRLVRAARNLPIAAWLLQGDDPRWVEFLDALKLVNDKEPHV